MSEASFVAGILIFFFSSSDLTSTLVYDLFGNLFIVGMTTNDPECFYEI